MPDLKNNFKAVQQRMVIASNNAKRSMDAIALLPASKARSVSTLKQAYDLGVTAFGENYVSEALGKMPDLPNDIEWHFIGPIQSNKTRLIAENFSWVQTIDREKTIQRLADQRPQSLPPLKCLIQVNISSEPQKAGCTPENTLILAKHISDYPSLSLQGLMAIPKADQNEQDLSADFAKMQLLSKALIQDFPEATHLSMGMSADFELAILYGATMIRLGTELFGPRQ